LAREYGHTMKVMDLGGGFPGLDISEELFEVLKTT
jgi:hypothetical protein